MVDFQAARQQQSQQIGQLGSQLGQPSVGGNLNTPEYYQTQRDQFAGGAGIPTQPNPQLQQQRSTIDPSTIGGLPGIPTAASAGPLGGAPDTGAIRRRLMGSVPGATDAAGLPYNAQFDQGVSNLYAQQMNKLAGYDQSQGRLMTDYETKRNDQLQAQDSAMKQLMDRLAFQGILSSGITTDQRAMLGQRYTGILGRLASAQAKGLEDIQTGRLNAQSAYQEGLGNLESGYTKNLSDWVQQQAQQQAARQMQQAQDAANSQLLQQLQAMQQKYYGQMAATQLPALSPVDEAGNPIDWAAVADAVKNGMNLPPGWRP